MAFPTVAATNSGNQATDVTSHTINLPTGITAGDLLLMFLSIDGGTSISGTPTGWTYLNGDATGSPGTHVLYKTAAGSEGSTVSITSTASEQSAHVTYRITGWHGTTPPEISSVTTGTDSVPNPGSIDPTGWDVEDTLWIAVGAWDDGTASATSYPSNYPDNHITARANSSTGVGIATAALSRTVASENPASFGLTTSEPWKTYTIAVRPEPGPEFAFAQVATSATSINATNTTSHTVNLPTGIEAGDLLVICPAFDGTSVGASTPAGWTRYLGSSSPQPSTYCWVKVATGSEGFSVTITTTASEQSAFIALRIVNWYGDLAGFDLSTAALVSSTSTSPNPGSITAPWGAESNLFVAAAVWDDGTTNATGFPTGYGDNHIVARTSTSGGVGAATASKSIAAASDNPAAFTLNASEAWRAWGFVVRPLHNLAPYIPSDLNPAGNIGTSSGVLSASVSDPDGDPITSVRIELYDETAAAYVSGYTDTLPMIVSTGLEDGVMTHDATSALVSGHSYRWRAKATDGVLLSDFSPWAYFTYGTNPSVTLTAPTSGAVLTTPGYTVTFTYSHPSGSAKIADRVILTKLIGGVQSPYYDSGWVGSASAPEARTSIPLSSSILRNSEHYEIKVMVQSVGNFQAETAYVPFDVAYTGPAALTPTATPDATRAEVFVNWSDSALTTDFVGYEVAVGDPTGTVSTANKTIVFYTSTKTLSQYTYPYPVSGESKGYYVRQLQAIGDDVVESVWTRVTATCDFGDRIFIKSAQDPYTLLFDFEVLRRSLPSQSKTASQQFIRTWGNPVPVELLGEGREATGSIDIPFYDSALFAQSAATRFAILEQIEALRGTVALLLSLPTKRKEFVAIEGDVNLDLDDNLKPTASLNWRRVDYSEDYYA